MQGNGHVGELLARRDYPSFCRVGPIAVNLHIGDEQRISVKLVLIWYSLGNI